MSEPHSDASRRIRRALLFLLVLLFAGTAFLRIDGIATRELEYDEIWTLENFLGKPCSVLFNDFSSTNNHPLHSILTKCVHAALKSGLPSIYPSLGYLSIRLIPLLCGILLLAACVAAVRTECRERWLPPAIFALILCGWNTQLIHYSSTSRGYSMQCLFLFLTAFALLRLGDPEEKRRIRFSVLAAGSALAAVFTIPNAAVFAAAAGLAWFAAFGHWKKPWKTSAAPQLLLIGAAAAVPALLWLIGNFEELNAARDVFAESVDSPAAFARCVAQAIVYSGLLPAAPILACGLFSSNSRSRRMSVFLLLFAAFSLASCLATGIWGEERIFLPLAAPLNLGAAILAGRFCEARPPWIVFACLIAVLGFCATSHALLMRILIPKPWDETARMIRMELPHEIYAIYPPAHGYAISFNHAELKKDHMLRLLAPTRAILSFAPEGVLEGVDTTRFFRTELKRNLRAAVRSDEGAAHPFAIYRIRPLTPDDDPAKTLLFAKLLPVPADERDRIREELADDDPLLLNLFFNAGIIANDDDAPRMGFFEILTAPKRDAAHYLEMRKRSGDSLFLYVPDEAGTEPRSFVR